MKKSEIIIGGRYTARVSTRLTVVQVLSVSERGGIPGRSGEKSKPSTTRYTVVNLLTQRETVFRSASRFREALSDAISLQLMRGQITVERAVHLTEHGPLPSTPTPTESATEQQEDLDYLPGGSRDQVASLPPGHGYRPATPRYGAGPTATSPTDPASPATNEPPAQDDGIYSPQESGGEAVDNDDKEVLLHPEDQADRLLREERPRKSPMAEKLRGLMRPRPQTEPHLIIEARAGTGKTTTLVEGLKLVLGGLTAFRPSEQQDVIWRAMRQSKGMARSVGFVAFNRGIATELQARVPPGCDAMTMHSQGLKAIQRAFPGTKVSNYRVPDILSDLLCQDIRDLRRDMPVVVRATEQLVGLCKQNLVPLDVADGADQAEVDRLLSELATHYDVDLTGEGRSGRGRYSHVPTSDYARQVFDLVPQVLERCRDVSDRCVDFNDMIWLPIALGLPVTRYDLLLVDEAQDLNICQQELALKAGDRLILCGDRHQSIYGFAGADTDSLPRMEERLGATPRGCQVLPLTVTRRCGKAIVREANKIVPDFEALDSSPEGQVSTAAYPIQESQTRGKYELPYNETYMPLVQEDDMVLCRVNAPLVSQCFRFIRRGRRANIQGRDIAAQLIGTIEKMNAVDVADLVGKVMDWVAQETAKEVAKRNPDENRLIAIQDRADCILCFTEGLAGTAGVHEVLSRGNQIFTDDKNAPGIRLSSIHKAKGLEARQVFLLRPKGAGCPHPLAKSEWQRQQEQNLLYVAITRAIDSLVFVS